MCRLYSPALFYAHCLPMQTGARGYVLVQLTNITGGTTHSPGARYAAAMAAVSDVETLLVGGVKQTGTGEQPAQKWILMGLTANR
jgi:hypothetical protein